ncbi:hypothetical protein PoMZ_08262 [Pyricularia oryzae]|uniref:Uncharacterized protein n=1 Tax=Pyricularia oryzae TaxID=318829 RepID=A0A4P7NHC3_PYROR|nr:hypothetical protein PoMZ_08262 [Pyricularia oryzae]
MAFSPMTPAAAVDPLPSALSTASALSPTLSHAPSSSLVSGGKKGWSVPNISLSTPLASMAALSPTSEYMTASSPAARSWPTCLALPHQVTVVKYAALDPAGQEGECATAVGQEHIQTGDAIKHTRQVHARNGDGRLHRETQCEREYMAVFGACPRAPDVVWKAVVRVKKHHEPGCAQGLKYRQ